jgi:hypothetical protein
MPTTINKPAPIVGMQVTWIETADDPYTERWIRRFMIDIYGRDGLKIHSFKKSGDDYIITLTKHGEIIPRTFHWDYLRFLK